MSPETWRRTLCDAKRWLPAILCSKWVEGGSGLRDCAVEEVCEGDGFESSLLESRLVSLLRLDSGADDSLGRCHGSPVVGCASKPNGIRKESGSRMPVSIQNRDGVASARATSV